MRASSPTDFATTATKLGYRGDHVNRVDFEASDLRMRNNPTPFVFAFLTGFAITSFAAESDSWTVQVETPSDWFAELESASYLTRIEASRRLFESATAIHPASSDSEHTIRLLRSGLASESMEVRLASNELLRRIEQTKRDHQIERLKNPRTPAGEIDLPGWDRYSRLVGADQTARDSFAELWQRYPRQLRDRVAFAQSVAAGDEDRLDPYRMSPDDPIGWTVVLWLAIEDGGRGNYRLSSRVATTLSNGSMGPESMDKDDTVVQRMIARWVETESNTPTARSNLLIAMRYRCFDQATRLCDMLLANNNPSPAAEVMAMLTAATLDRDDVDSQLWQRLGDQRTAHVWQLIASRKTRIRTQVRDVALALLLHRRGLDPRDFGFEELQADPMLIYRDHSLGFRDDESRREAHAKAVALLSNTKSSANH